MPTLSPGLRGRAWAVPLLLAWVATVEALVGLLREYVLTLLWWVVFVAPHEQGLRIRSRKHMRVLRPGRHLRIPFVDRIHVKATTLRTAKCPLQTIGDLSFAGEVNYEIDDMKQLYMSFALAEDSIISLARQALSDAAVLHGDQATAQSIAQHAEESVKFGTHGLKRNAKIRVTTFVRARTYRLLTDSPDTDTYGSALDTEGLGDEYE